MIARNVVEFWPRPDVPAPPAVAAYLEALTAWIGLPSPADLADPNVAFYVARNPGYATGEMLAVLVPLHFANWRAILWHAMRRRFHRTPTRAA